MPSFYAIGSKLAGGGIGNTAYHGAAGVARAGRLGRLVALGHNAGEIPDDLITDVRFVPRGAARFLADKPFYWLKNRWFDRACRGALSDDFDVVHLWNSQATRTAREAHGRGQHLIIDRASTHIRTQTQLLRDAYARLGIDYEPTYLETIDRCAEEYDLADIVLTPSHASFQSFADQGFDLRKVVRCPFGVDASRLPARETAPATFTALFVGQIGVRKGIVTLLEAWDRAGIDGQLWLVGGEERAVGPRLAPWRDRADIRWLSFRNDVPELMRQASALVFPTVEEGSALVTYEAMAAGLPQVVTAVSGTVARDGQEALVVPPHDVDALAAAITRLADDGELAWAMGRRARARVEQFPWTAYGDRVALVHERLAAGDDGAAIQAALLARWPEI